jgi:hypothetical protein
MPHRPSDYATGSWDQPDQRAPALPQAAPQRPATVVIEADTRRRMAPAPAKVKSRHGLYAVSWATAGLMAGAYVVTVLVNQDANSSLMARLEPLTQAVPQALPRAATAPSEAVDLAQLQKSVGTLETDMARLKAGAAQQDEREKNLTSRMAVVETRVELFATTLTQAPVPSAAAGRIAKAPPLPPVGNAANIRTGTLPTPALTAPALAQDAAVRSNPSPTVVADTNGQQAASAVLLARGPSLDALRLSWSLMNERHKGTLKALEPRVVQVEPGSYQLVAGPIANPAEALKVCAALKARGVACQAADFKGDAL